MKQSMKKLLSLLVAIVMAVSLLPATAMAAEYYDVWVGGVRVNGLNAGDVLGDGTVVFTPATESVPARLTLYNADIVGTSLPKYPDDNFGIYSEIDLTLALHGTNTITAEDAVADADCNGIYGNQTKLVIVGDGTLDVTAGKGEFSHAIYAKKLTMRGVTVRATAGEASTWSAAVDCSDFVMEDGTLEATSGKGRKSYAVDTDETTVLGGTIRAVSGESSEESAAVYSTKFVMEGGTLEATAGKSGSSRAIISQMTMRGGTVRATGGEASNDSVAILAGTLVMVGGTLEAAAGKGQFTYGIETDSMTVLGGAIRASAGNASSFCKAVYSNDFAMEGGSLTALGGEAPESWGIDGGGPITGGAITAIGHKCAVALLDLSGYDNPSVTVNTEPSETGASAWSGKDKLNGSDSGFKYVKVAPYNPFTDVPEGQYYYDPVLWAIGQDPQITTGTSADKFSPNATCTRAQVVTFLWRAMGEPEPTLTANPFTDVKADQYYYKAVLWALENGITTGTSADKFSPNSGCTRGQVVTFLHRTQGTPMPGSLVNPFTDVADGQYYYAAVLWAVNHSPQITNGTSATTFSPNATCTRGQIVTFLYRAFNKPPVYRGPNDLKDDDFLIYVEEVFTVTDRGTVVTGRVQNGRVDVGDRLRLLSWDSSTRKAKEYTVTVEAVEMFHKVLDYAEKGDNIGLQISGTAIENVQKGAALVDVGTERRFKSYARSVKGELRVDGDSPVYVNFRPQFNYGGACEVAATFTDLGDATICEPGEDCDSATVSSLLYPVFWYVGQEITIRKDDKTVGTFTVTLIEEY